MMQNINFRKATVTDLEKIRIYTDFWLSGRGKKIKAAGAVNDYFISPRQHKKYITKYTVHIALEDEKIIAWAVIDNKNTLINFLIAGDKRNQGLGKKLLNIIQPQIIRSKSNQSSGNPAAFYEKCGYIKTGTEKPTGRYDIEKRGIKREKIIDIFQQKNHCK